MKRLMILAALLTLTASAIGCGQGGLRNMCRPSRPMNGCDQCQTYAGMPAEGVVYQGVVDGGIIEEEIPAGKSSTRP